MAYEKIKLSDIARIEVLNVEGGITAPQIMSKYKPDYLLNGALYDTKTGVNIVKMLSKGVASGYLFSDEGINFDNVKWSGNKGCKNYIAGAPTIVKDSKQYIDWGNKYSSTVDGLQSDSSKKPLYRSAVGFNQEHIYLLTSDHANTLESLSSYCIEQEMTHAINLDGGGSCHIQKGSKIIKKSTRANASWILVYLKK